MATGTVKKGDAPFEAGASKRDTDYLHIIDWRKAEQVFKAGKAQMINGFPVIMLDTSFAEGLLHFAPEPKSPHGVDVTPNGQYMVVAGKLDPHVTVYSIDRIKKAIADRKYSNTDEFGVPVLDFDSVKEAQVELGLGPLHTQFDDKGYAYTSLFLDSAVARWSLGGEYASLHPEQPWKLVTKTPVQYNIGHLCAAEGDTVSPDGNYLISMSKWSVDRFLTTGPLLPQNFQLLDIAANGTVMPVLYDMPVGVGEPHYCQMIKADKLKTWSVYPEVGWNPHTQSLDSLDLTEPVYLCRCSENTKPCRFACLLKRELLLMTLTWFPTASSNHPGITRSTCHDHGANLADPGSFQSDALSVPTARSDSQHCNGRGA
jgi:nitrous-oxide reductase